MPNNEKNLFIIRAIIDDIVIQTGNTKTEILKNLEEISYSSLNLREIIEKETIAYNITLGDLLLFFKVLEESEFYYSHKNLIDVIKLLYTIWLSDYFDNKNYDEILHLTNGGVYNPGYKAVLRGKRSRFQINEKIFQNKPDADNIELLKWLIYFIEYPQNSSFRSNVKPYYRKEINIGSGHFLSPIFNTLNIFTTSLFPKLQTERFNENREVYPLYFGSDDLELEMISWLSNYKFIFPIFNIFTLEKLLWGIDTDYKEEASFSDLFHFLFSQIEDFLTNLEEAELFYVRYEIVDAFKKCPLVAPILNKDKDYEAFLNSIHQGQKNISKLIKKINDTKRKSIDILNKDILRWALPLLTRKDFELLSFKLAEISSNVEDVIELQEQILVFIESIKMHYE